MEVVDTSGAVWHPPCASEVLVTTKNPGVHTVVALESPPNTANDTSSSVAPTTTAAPVAAPWQWWEVSCVCECIRHCPAPPAPLLTSASSSPPFATAVASAQRVATPALRITWEPFEGPAPSSRTPPPSCVHPAARYAWRTVATTSSLSPPRSLEGGRQRLFFFVCRRSDEPPPARGLLCVRQCPSSSSSSNGGGGEERVHVTLVSARADRVYPAPGHTSAASDQDGATSRSLLRDGVTFVVRFRNEAATLDACLRSIVGVADHIVAVDNASTDDSAAVARRVADAFPGRVTLASYPLRVPAVGAEQRRAVGAALRYVPPTLFDESRNVNTLAAFNNFALRLAPTRTVFKWDGDMVAVQPTLARLLTTYHASWCRSSNDGGGGEPFAVWCTGETVFYDEARQEYWRKSKSDYDEYRWFSKQHGFVYGDYPQFESSQAYWNRPDVVKLHFPADQPVFREIRPVQRVLARAVVDERDRVDARLCTWIRDVRTSSSSSSCPPELVPWQPSTALVGGGGQKLIPDNEET